MKRILFLSLVISLVYVSLAEAAPIFVTGTNKLCIDPVTTNVNGTPVTNLSGYTFHFGTVAGGPYTITKDVGLTPTPTAPCALMSGLALSDGNYFVVVRAYKTLPPPQQSLISVNSNEINIVLETNTPAGPTNLRVQ